MTQAEFAELLGVGQSNISGIEHGRFSLAPAHYATVCSIFGLDRKVLAKALLRYTNPHLYALTYGVDDEVLKSDLEDMARSDK